VFTWVDHFFAGEADVAFPDFCERYVKENYRPPHRVISCAPIKDMREVHHPDFSDYFTALRHEQSRGRLPLGLPEFVTMESSRGCWWGEKHHCTFCGLNAEGMAFRRKHADQVAEEIKALTSAWDVKSFFMADNIMPMSYLNDLLPTLAQWERPPRLFYEVKSNLREDQLTTMARGGIHRIQPGIESFSSNVLRLMRKGVSAMQNLALLRLCRSAGITVAWNYLYGFPGESLEDYRDVISLVPAIEHFDPPSGCVAVIIDRFSPYFDTPEQFGIGEISPRECYLGLYPQTAPLQDIAFHFGGGYSTPLLADETMLGKLRAAVELWRAQWTPKRPPVLMAIDKGSGGIAVADTRRIAKAQMTVVPRAIYQTLTLFDRPRKAGRLEGANAEHVEYLLDRNYLVQHEGQLLNVVTSLPGSQTSSRSQAPLHSLRASA
jgi:ribosomal peptide maturation radical SAM protein 1